MTKTLIVIVSFNSKRYTQECIESIRRCVSNETYGIAVVDNASTDGSSEWLMQQPDIILTRNDQNLGFGPACNQAVRSSVGTEFENANIFLLNNDTVLTHNSLPKLIQALEKSDNIGAVSAMANYAGNRQQLDVEFSSTEEYVRFGENLKVSDEDCYMERVRLNGFAMLIRRHLWDKIGGFDEDFAPGYYEDDALSIEILKQGYRLVLVRDSFIYHVGSASFVKTGTNQLSIDHYHLFIKKYGFDILKYVYPCEAVISQIPFDRKDTFSVLHLGSGLGAEIKAIRSLYPNSKVYGIENSTVLYEISHYTENVYVSVEEAINNLVPKSIDLLIADSEYLNELNNEEKTKLESLLSETPLVIHRLHDYDDYDFDSLKMVVFDSPVYCEDIANMLSRHGLIVTKEITDDIRQACDFTKKQILFISQDSTIIPYLTAHFEKLKENDPKCYDQKRFEALKKRFEDMSIAVDKNEFVKNNPVTISVNRNCLEASEVIYKSLNDANILCGYDTSFDKNHIERMASDSWNDCAYITARDTYGHYGIVGFSCRNNREGRVIISVCNFAASALNLESYIRSGFSEVPFGVKIDTFGSIDEDMILKKQLCILLKGDHNLAPVADYLIGGSVTCEFYNGEKDSLPTKIFTDRFHVIVYSLLQYNESESSNLTGETLGSIFETLERFRESAPGNPVLIILTYDVLYPIIEEFALDHDKTKTINISELIQSPSDYDGSSGTYSTRVISDLTEMIVSVINDNF